MWGGGGGGGTHIAKGEELKDLALRDETTAILRLNRDKPVVSSERRPDEHHFIPPKHWQLSHMSESESGQWRETVSSQWQRLRPLGHRGRP